MVGRNNQATEAGKTDTEYFLLENADTLRLAQKSTEFEWLVQFITVHVGIEHGTGAVMVKFLIFHHDGRR